MENYLRCHPTAVLNFLIINITPQNHHSSNVFTPKELKSMIRSVSSYSIQM